MSANPLPASNSLNIIQGSFDYFNLEELLSTGAALASPYTTPTKKISIVGDITIDVKDNDASIAPIAVKTPAFGRGYTAVHAADVTALAATVPPDMTVTLTVEETSAAHMGLFALLKGKYYALVIPFGIRGSAGKTVDAVFFVKFDTTVQQKYVDGKETNYTLKAIVQNNSVEVVATVPTDSNIHASALTIPANAGYLIVESV